MRFLRILGARLENVGLRRDILRTKLLGDESAGFELRLLRHVHAVRTHVGDEADSAALTDVDALVEVLRHAHRARGGHPQLLTGVLLKRAGGERRIGPAPALAALDRGDRVGRPRQIRNDGRAVLAILQIRFLPSDTDQPRREARPRLLPARRLLSQLGIQRPVLDRHERQDLALALNDQPQRHGLDAAGRQPASAHVPTAAG